MAESKTEIKDKDNKLKVQLGTILESLTYVSNSFVILFGDMKYIEMISKEARLIIPNVKIIDSNELINITYKDVKDRIIPWLVCLPYFKETENEGVFKPSFIQMKPYIRIHYTSIIFAPTLPKDKYIHYFYKQYGSIFNEIKEFTEV